MALNSKTRLSRSGHGIKNKPNNADDERAPECRPKIIHIKMRAQDVADEIEQQRIDHQGEKA